jgi:leader peptidase (prepilin peptidase) / N-methyltransferase
MFNFELFLLIFPIFLLGLILGSFLNCLIWRLYKGETVLGRSYCPKCKKQIKWYDNIPVVSFFILKRKCRFCEEKISWQYPLVEIVTGVLFSFSFYLNFLVDFSIIKLILNFLLILILIIVFVFDWRWFLIPVQVLIFGGVVAFVLNLSLGFSVWQIFLSALVGAGFFALQYLITRGKGLGEGDIWLGAFLGLAFPALSHILALIFLAYIIGGLVAIILLILGSKKMGSKLPLGIFLSTSAIIVLFFGENIINWYLGLIF